MSAGEDFSKVQNAVEESELLLVVYRAVIESGDLRSGLRTALQKVCEHTGWVVGSAWLPSEDCARLSLYSWWHRAEPQLDEFIAQCRQRAFEPGVGLIGRTWQGARSEWSQNLSAEPVHSYPMALTAAQANLKASFAVPVIHDDQVDGVLLFHAREPKARDGRFIEMISRIASQIDFALRHKRLEDDLADREYSLLQTREILQRQVASSTVELSNTNEMLEAELAVRERVETMLAERVRQQDAVAELGRYALGGMALAELMQTVTELTARVLNVEFCKVLELLPDGEALLLRAGVGWKPGLVGSATVGAGLDSQGGYTLNCKHPVLVLDLRTENRFTGPPLLRDHDVISGISVIIGSPDRPFGVLGAHTITPREFSSTDVSFLQSIANVLSQAIDQQRAIEQTRRSALWLERLISTTQDAVLSIDRRGRIVLFNPAAEQIFGYAQEEIIGEKVNTLMAEPYSSEHDEYIARYESTGEARAIGQIRTVTARRKSGELFPIELSVTEIAVDNDVRYAAFIRDISEKTRLQGQLVESERLAAIGNTAAKIRHELANPLNGMSLTVQLIEQRLNRLAEPVRNEIKPTVRRLTDEISRLQKLLNEFGAISKREEYVFELVNLAELIDDLVQLQAPFLKEKGVECFVSMDADLPLVRADADKIKQAILNLIKNAGEAMRKGGTIRISGAPAKNFIVLEISDSGEGIPLDIDAFQPFVTSKRDGTGLGLVIVRQIVIAHRGKISYRSTPGEGTTFRIELPQA